MESPRLDRRTSTHTNPEAIMPAYVIAHVDVKDPEAHGHGPRARVVGVAGVRERERSPPRWRDGLPNAGADAFD